MLFEEDEIVVVPNTGILSVAFLQACKAGVALAMIKSTPSATKLEAIVEQVFESPEAT